MSTDTFKRQLKALGFQTRKQRDLEVFDVLRHGKKLFSVTWAEVFDTVRAQNLLEKHRVSY